MLDIDASFGEGGGQLLRTGVALSAITGTAVRFSQIRAKRDKPGLAPQHLAAVKAVAEICSAQVEGLALRAQTLTFMPGKIRSGNFRFDIGTAGSITLLLQALLPVLISASGPSQMTVTGGTDVRAAPPLDYFSNVLLRLLRTMGVEAQLETRRRGYYPRGGGEVEIRIMPARLKPLQIESCGALTALRGVAHVANLPAHIVERMRAAALEKLGDIGAEAQIETSVLDAERAIGQGGALVLWAETRDSTLGSGRVAERGLRAEVLGESAAAELRADLACGATVDIHAADQLLIYAALARSDSRFTVRELSSHAQTAMWLIGRFLPIRFRTEAQGACVAVTVSHALGGSP
jgi:RNA 3'-terminal phosphate cyclase (ATP)